MDDALQQIELNISARQEHQVYRHLQADRRSVRRILSMMEFSAACLKAQMLGEQAKTIAQRGNDTR